MLGLSVIATAINLVRDSPRMVSLLLVFVVCVLLAMLFLSCANTLSAFTDVYLAEFTYSTNTTLIEAVETALDVYNHTSSPLVRVGYIGICLITNGSNTCVNHNNVTTLMTIGSMESSSGVEFSPVHLAAIFANHDIFPFPLIIAFVFAIISFILHIWCCVSSNRAAYFQKASLSAIGCTFVSALVWFMGCLWAHVAVQSAVNLVSGASTDVITVKMGSRSAGMHWASFALLVFAGIILIAAHIRDARRAINSVKGV